MTPRKRHVIMLNLNEGVFCSLEMAISSTCWVIKLNTRKSI